MLRGITSESDIRRRTSPTGSDGIDVSEVSSLYLDLQRSPKAKWDSRILAAVTCLWKPASPKVSIQYWES